MRQRRRLITAVSLVAALGLVAAACGDDDDDSSSGATTTAASGATTTAGAATTAGGATTTAGGATTTAAEEGACKPGTVNNPEIETLEADGAGKSVGLLFDVTGRGDKSFNDSAAAAVDRAKADFGIESQESTPTASDGSDRPERIKSFVGTQDLIIANGFLWGDATTASAAENPDQAYAIIDSVVNRCPTRRRRPRRRPTCARWCSPRTRARLSSVPPRRVPPRPARSASSAASSRTSSRSSRPATSRGPRP